MLEFIMKQGIVQRAAVGAKRGQGNIARIHQDSEVAGGRIRYGSLFNDAIPRGCHILKRLILRCVPKQAVCVDADSLNHAFFAGLG